MSVTTSLDLLDLVFQAVLAADTNAEGRVYKPGDWPVQPDQYPIVKMRLLGESRQGIAVSGGPEFTTTATIRLQLEVSAPATIDDVGATAAETNAWTLKRQVEVAIINSYPLFGRIQNLAAIRSQLAFSSEAATHLAGVQMDLDLVFYEGPESFAAIEAVPLTAVRLTDTHHPGAGFLDALPQ